MLDYVRKHYPESLIAENVKTLTHKLPDGRTHADFLVEELNKSGYLVHVGLRDASDSGLPEKRPRWYGSDFLRYGYSDTFMC